MAALNGMEAEVHGGQFTADEATAKLLPPMELLAKHEKELCSLLDLVSGNPERFETITVRVEVPAINDAAPGMVSTSVDIPVRVRVVDMVFAKRKQIEEAAAALHGAYKETIGSVERLMNFDPNPATAAVASDAHG